MQLTPNYGLVIPEVTDNINSVTLPNIGSSNTTIDTQIKSLHDSDDLLQANIDDNYTTLDGKIDDNYTTLDTKIDTQDNIINSRIDNLILHSAPLPEVAAQQVYDACYSPVYDITYDVLTDRLTAIETESFNVRDDMNTLQTQLELDMTNLQNQVNIDIDNMELYVQNYLAEYSLITRSGGII